MRDTLKTLKRDLSACLSIVTDLDTALGDPLKARNLAFDLEARLHDALDHAEGILEEGRLEAVLEGTMQLETLLCAAQEERPEITASSPLALILDQVFIGLHRIAVTLDPCALNSCMVYTHR